MTPLLQDKILACHTTDEIEALLPEIEFGTKCGTIEWRITREGDAVTLVNFENPSSRVRLHYRSKEETLTVEAVWDGDFCGEASVGSLGDRLFLLILDATLRRCIPTVPSSDRDEIARAISVRSAVLFTSRDTNRPLGPPRVGDIVHPYDEDITVSEMDVGIYHLLDAHWQSGNGEAVVAAMKQRGPRWVMELVTRLLITAGRNFNVFLDHEIMPEDGLGGREFIELLLLLHREEYPETMVPLPIVQIAAAFVCRLWETFDAAEGKNSWLSLLTVLDEEPLGDVLRRLSP